jgi:basic membrane protein A
MYGTSSRIDIKDLAAVTLCGLAMTGCAPAADDPNAARTVRMLNSGSRTDASWTQQWFQGLQAASEAAGGSAELEYSDQLNSPEALERAGSAALAQGADVVIFATSQVPQALDRLGARHPDAFVCGAEGPREKYLANVCTIYPHVEDGAFLAGVLAGRTTKTGRVGVIAAFDSPTQTSQVEAFAVGARYARPDIVIDKAYTQSLSDSGLARAAADAQYAAGADIILVALSEGVRGVFDAATRAHGLVIAQYDDYYDQAPEVVLSSVLYRLDEVSKRMLETAAAGELEPKSYEFSLANGPFGQLAEFRGAPGALVTPETRALLSDLEAKLRSGELDVPDIHEIGRRGAADQFDLSEMKG